MNKIKVLGVDPSFTGTGLCDGVRAWLIRTPATLPLEERIITIVDQVLVHAAIADVVLIEDPISHGASNNLVQMGGLAWSLRVAFTRNGIRWVGIGNSQRAKWATGKGNAKKVEVLVAAREKLHYGGHDDNEADAMWFHNLGDAAYNSGPIDYPRYKREVLGEIDWPAPRLGPPPSWPRITAEKKPRKAKGAA